MGRNFQFKLGRLKLIVCFASARAFNFLARCGKKTQYFAVCVVFSRARIQFLKFPDAKHTFNFKRPYVVF